MDYEFRKFPFLTIALFSGLFSGFLLTLVNLVYDFVYRGITNYSYSQIINVSSIIFLSILLLVVAGFLYYFLVKFVKRGDLIYSALLIAGTVLLTVSLVSHNYAQPYAGGFKWLSAGEVICTGVFAAFCVPYFAKHNEAFL
jgi:cellobiose-specific phosphotransferase system component IIC